MARYTDGKFERTQKSLKVKDLLSLQGEIVLKLKKD